MSKGKALYVAGNKLIKWLPDYFVPNMKFAENFSVDESLNKELGSRGKQVTSLLDYMSRASDDAGKISSNVSFLPFKELAYENAQKDAMGDIIYASKILNTRRDKELSLATMLAERNKFAKKVYGTMPTWERAILGEMSSDLNNFNRYRTLTNPLATGLETDILAQTAPKNFMGILRNLSERNLITNPYDVRSARKLADLSDYERNYVMEFINAMVGNADDGYRYSGSPYKSLEEIIAAGKII